MSMTLATALTALRERLGETTAAAWTDVELRRWISEGQIDVCRRTECLQTTTNVPWTAGIQSNTLSFSPVRIHRAEWISTGESRIVPLEYRDFNAMDSVWWTQQAVTQGNPLYFTLWGYAPTLKLVLYPTPQVSGTLRVHYYKTPARLDTTGSGDAANLEVPDGWEEMVLDYAEYMALRKDLQPRWTEAKSLYEEHVNDAYDLSRRWSDQTGGYITGAGGGLPAWLVEG